MTTQTFGISFVTVVCHAFYSYHCISETVFFRHISLSTFGSVACYFIFFRFGFVYSRLNWVWYSSNFIQLICLGYCIIQDGVLAS